MSRVKILIFVLVLVPIIIVGAVLILLANPEYYRDQLRSTILEQTGYELNIKGEMKWRYWPPIALRISDVVVTPKGKTEPLATLKVAAMDLSLLPLLFGSQEISVKGIDVDGLTVNATVDENGMANWVVEMEAAPGDDSSATKPDSGEGFSLDIGGIDVTNTIINYQDHAAKTDYTVEIARIETGPVRYDVPVAIDIELSIADNTAGMMIDATAGGTITFDANFNRIHFDKLKVSQSITLPDMVPLTLSVTLAGMFDTVVSKLDTRISGDFGTPGTDNTAIDGFLAADMSDKTSVVFDLSLDRIDVGPYLGAAEVTQAAPAGPPQDVEVLPVALLEELNIDGIARIGTLIYETYQFTNIVADIDNGNQEFTTDLTMDGYDGSIHLAFTASTKAGGAGHTLLNLTGVDISKLAEFESLTGSLSLQSNTTFTGTMLSNVMDTLDGTTNFSIKDGTLDVRPVKKVALVVDALRGKNSGIGIWPDLMPFANMQGQHRFIQGTQDGQTFDFVLENMTVSGSGGFDYFKNNLDFQLALVLAETSTGRFRVAPGLAGIEWPLHCKGGFDQSPADICKADKNAVEKILTSLAREAVTDKALEKLGVEGEGDLKEKAKSLLKGLFNRDG